MSQDTLTDSQVGTFLSALGNYRVRRIQQVANVGPSDGITGEHLLALGLRESHGKNIEGGAKLVDGRWVKEDDPNRMDVGVFQISRIYHKPELALMPGVKVGTWTPIVEGRTAADGGYCPRFEDSLRYILPEMHEAQAYASDHGVADADLARFAIAAHNGGIGGALKGYREGNVDKYTTMGDYSAWVVATKKQVVRWLLKHPNWKV